jgi:hypothetical protein
MPTPLKWFLAAALTLVAGPLRAQTPDPLSVLILNKSVQEELKLTEDQVAIFKKVQTEVNAELNKQLAKYRKQEKDLTARGAKLDATATEEANKALALIMEDVFTEEQKKRFKQLDVQGRGLGAFNLPEVQKALQLTEKQKGAVEGLTDLYNRLFARFSQDARSNPQASADIQRRFTALVTEIQNTLNARLTEAQKTAWKDLTGAAFTFQGQGARFGAVLILNPSVQEHLKVSQEDAKQFKKVTEDVRAKHKDEIEELKEKQQELKEKAKDFPRHANAQLWKALAKSIGEALDEEQQKRFKQLRLQRQGIQAFATAEIQKALKLTEEQKAEIKPISDSMLATFQEIQQQAQKEAKLNPQKASQIYQKAQAKVDSLQQESIGKALGKLTLQQKKLWREMVGEPFDYRLDLPATVQRPDGKTKS